MAQPTAIEAFPAHLTRELEMFLQAHQNKTMFTSKKRKEYRYWLLHPEEKAQGDSAEA